MHPANLTLRSSSALIEHVKRSEGLKTKAYFDAAGVPTVGYGHISGITAAMVKQGRTFTAEQCAAWLVDDLKVAENAVKDQVNVALTQNQFDALVDFVFNLGAGAFQRSTLLKKLNAGDYAAVPAQLLRWDKAKVNKRYVVLRGLTIRRQWEATLFATASTVPAPTTPEYGDDHPDATVSPVQPTLWDLFVKILFLIFGALEGAKPKQAGGGW